jgi:hypothetical protein
MANVHIQVRVSSGSNKRILQAALSARPRHHQLYCCTAALDQHQASAVYQANLLLQLQAGHQESSP